VTLEGHDAGGDRDPAIAPLCQPGEPCISHSSPNDQGQCERRYRSQEARRADAQSFNRVHVSEFLECEGQQPISRSKRSTSHAPERYSRR
jgi:hypothetical protein